MQKQATVTGASFLKSFEGKYGTMFVHSIQFDNGDAGEYLSKTQDQNKFMIGQQVDYTIESAGEYQGVPQYKVKPVVQNTFSGGGGYSKRGGGNASFALSYSKDLAVANIAAANQVSSEQVIQIADKFLNWLNANQW